MTGQPLLSGERLPKVDPVIDVCGALDEAVAALSPARSLPEERELEPVVLALQRGPFAVAAEVVANLRARERLVPEISCVTAEMTAKLEYATPSCAEHPLRPAFVVGEPPRPRPRWTWPGHSCAGRRAPDGRPRRRPATVIAFVNRASDLAYALVRRAAGEREEPISHA